MVVFGQWFSNHGFLIPALELGFHRLEDTLYCIVNSWKFFIFGLFLWFLGQQFLAHSFLILVLELGFRRWKDTLYCIVNIWNNAMKETKRAVKLLVGVSLQGFQGNICVHCVNVVVYFSILIKDLYALLDLNMFKT